MSEERTTRVKIEGARRGGGKTNWKRLQSMTDQEAHSNASADPDNPPLTNEELAGLEGAPDVGKLRARLGMTQVEFAQAYRLSPATLRDWEQGRCRPGQAARTLLKLIAREPEAVAQALR